MDNVRCRYEDCAEGHPVVEDDDKQVTCPACRKELGLPVMTKTMSNNADRDDVPPEGQCYSEQTWERQSRMLNSLEAHQLDGYTADTTVDMVRADFDALRELVLKLQGEVTALQNEVHRLSQRTSRFERS